MPLFVIPGNPHPHRASHEVNLLGTSLWSTSGVLPSPFYLFSAFLFLNKRRLSSKNRARWALRVLVRVLIRVLIRVLFVRLGRSGGDWCLFGSAVSAVWCCAGGHGACLALKSGVRGWFRCCLSCWLTLLLGHEVVVLVVVLVRVIFARLARQSGAGQHAVSAQVTVDWRCLSALQSGVLMGVRSRCCGGYWRLLVKGCQLLSRCVLQCLAVLAERPSQDAGQGAVCGGCFLMRSRCRGRWWCLFGVQTGCRFSSGYCLVC